MDLSQFFKSIIDQDKAAVVICDLRHIIIYMNPAAKQQYAKHGELAGKSLLDCHNERSREMIQRVAAWFSESPEHNLVHTFYNQKQNKDVYMVALRDGEKNLIGYYEKHEYRNRDTSEFYDFS
ncbi:MAG: fatty acid/phospholipid synthesis protein PlsX [Firmicutes bacterium]|nr:fatty acid/phospholipid synthesis protein PlsX [[Eubacterium] siraeum]MCM1489017.1 fatty acid/phospholipid synthesis protein PlsX [Bacillota bacterium]